MQKFTSNRGVDLLKLLLVHQFFLHSGGVRCLEPAGHPPPALFGRAAWRSHVGSKEGRSSEQSRVVETRRAINIELLRSEGSDVSLFAV